MRDSNPVLDMLVVFGIIILLLGVLTIAWEGIALVAFASDPLHWAPKGATQSDRVLLGVGLLIIACVTGNSRSSD